MRRLYPLCQICRSVVLFQVFASSSMMVGDGEAKEKDSLGSL